MTKIIRRDVTECGSRVRYALRALRDALKDEFPHGTDVQVSYADIHDGFKTRTVIDVRVVEPRLVVVPEPTPAPEDSYSPATRFFCTCGHPGMGCSCR